ncbi:MAG TPA: 50S ribosomal protein L18 [Crocinitomicaceae bacterium]|nr:50S ribosomal protein L18 [Crocinitomicaceae bacterium]
MALTKLEKRIRIKRRIRKSINGTEQRPRLSVFRSNRQMYAQMIDDVTGKTLLSASSLKNEGAQKVNKIEQAKLIGAEIAEKAISAGINACVFDRNGFLYHGRVQALAEAAREKGLKF